MDQNTFIITIISANSEGGPLSYIITKAIIVIIQQSVSESNSAAPGKVFGLASLQSELLETYPSGTWHESVLSTK